jgi:RimJ/RimL family protein N-acetyltransferase
MPFELQPAISDQRVRLQPLAAGDFEALYAVAADPLIWAQHPNPDRYQRDVFQNFFKGAVESGGALLVFDAASHQLIGSSRYYDLDEANGTIAIGYTFLARDHWGGAYNRALKTLMLDHALKFVHRALFHVGENNRRSRIAMERLGGKLIGALPVSYYGEASTGNVIYQIDRDDWARLRPRD